MTIRNLEHAVRPKSVAVFGASGREGAVGEIVMRNIVEAGFEGAVWPVNPKYKTVKGRRCYQSVKELPEAPDLAVIATPPKTVPAIIADLGSKGTRAAVVITAGLTHDNGLRQAMLDAAKPHNFRVIGPNTLGLLIPPARLNASFSHLPAAPGNLALLSQSGAIATSMIDWAAEEGIGFSQIVSLGDMADVDVGDYLDMLAGDAHTRAILMYLETVPHARKFMSAARAAARIKPVIVIKSGRHAEAAKAAATHTGALSGADAVVDAALRRAGLLRVKDLNALFDAAEIVARFPPLEHARVAIVTNGGGAGVLSVDRLIDENGTLASLDPATIKALDAVLPANWSRANPVDIIGDAPPERFEVAVKTVAGDPKADAILVLNCPTGLASASDAARAVAALTTKGCIGRKPVLTCWLGEKTAREGRSILQEAGVASFETPAQAAAALSYLGDWSRARKALMRVPASRSEDIHGDVAAVRDIFRTAAGEGRRMLTEPEAKAVLAAYGIPVPETIIAATPREAGEAAGRLLKTTKRVVVKLLSKTITHKSDVGGVELGIATPGAAREAAERIAENVAKAHGAKALDGYAVQPMVERPSAQELILGVSRDPIFGPAILFGAGGTAVEVVNDTAIALPPLDDVLSGDLVDSTRVGRLLAGYRDRKPADREALLRSLNALSQMVVELPCIVSVDINPLLAESDGVIAIDARIEIEPDRVEETGPNPDLAIRPWPDGWEADAELGGAPYHLRPIKPTDVALYPRFLERVSPEDVRLRFLAPRRHFPNEMLLRLTQLDHDRDIAFVALEASSELAGIGRLSCDPDHEWAEFALLVRTDLQGHGLGWTLLGRLIDYARADGIARIEGIVLADNTKMLAMCRDFGFTIKPHPEESGVVLATLVLARARKARASQQ